ncbi:hypothetical protein GCM10010215_57400 [Streptomyces virginiae]|uniref:Uncharacterized protein n=1 Tax=Streptomyces virginiae TaxID=1961 RepID=A0ABQ3NEB9_STRVG|nr:hypothetical protein GCM10010215_57400 [Streptomyces virginiae]GHI11088.1 hypothetical protein Scinn_05510 [Streptomyces virginiae]GLV94143.1 hypothetical protein Slala04_55970 [Streptomyces lavendulae subsp. lavendulae]
MSTGPSTTACAGVTPNCTVCRSRQARASAGFTLGNMSDPLPVRADSHRRISRSPATVPLRRNACRKLSTGTWYSAYEMKSNAASESGAEPPVFEPRTSGTYATDTG